MTGYSAGKKKEMDGIADEPVLAVKDADKKPVGRMQYVRSLEVQKAGKTKSTGTSCTLKAGCPAECYSIQA